MGTSYKGPDYKCLVITGVKPKLTQDPEEPYPIHILTTDLSPLAKEGSRVTFDLDKSTQIAQNLVVKR